MVQVANIEYAIAILSSFPCYRHFTSPQPFPSVEGAAAGNSISQH